MREIFSSRAWNEWSRAHFPEGILTKSGLPEGILTQIHDIFRASLANTNSADAVNPTVAMLGALLYHPALALVEEMLVAAEF